MNFYKKRSLLYELVWVFPLLSVIYYFVSKLFLGGFYTATIIAAMAMITLFILLLSFVKEGSISKRHPSFRGVLVIDTTNPDKDYFSLELVDDLFDLNDKDVIFFKVSKM